MRLFKLFSLYMNKKNKRSPKFPGHTVEEALTMFGAISDILAGDEDRGTKKEEIIKSLGFSGPSGPARKAIASLVGYGLIDRKSFSASELGKRVVEAANPAEEKGLLSHLALNPPMFARFFQRARGIQPDDLIRLLMERGFTASGAKRAVRVYAANAEFCGLDANASDLPPPGQRRRGPGRRARRGQMGGRGGPGGPRRGMRPEMQRRAAAQVRVKPPQPGTRLVLPLGGDQEVALTFAKRPKPHHLAKLRRLLAVIEAGEKPNKPEKSNDESAG